MNKGPHLAVKLLRRMWDCNHACASKVETYYLCHACGSIKIRGIWLRPSLLGIYHEWEQLNKFTP
jgi:hypothetical protein